MKIFCSGIGGIGLSAYAAYQKHCGHDVSGSDSSRSSLTEELQKQGIAVSDHQDGSAVPVDCDLFVYTLALREDHPERLRAQELGVEQQTYFQALGSILRMERAAGKSVICICGTHGKSSTTAMTAKVFIEAGLDPSVIIGTTTDDLQGRNWRRGEGKYFIVEACEYRRSFLHLPPDIILLTNVDGDHFDAFHDMEDYRSAFRSFLSLLPESAFCIAHGNDPDAIKLVQGAQVRFVDADGVPDVSLVIPGAHMRSNARLVEALSLKVGIPSARASLGRYAGCTRRMQYRGKTVHGVSVYDDYGHHPTEIAATLAAFREQFPAQRMIVVFQPHTHDRTLKLYSEFTAAFSDANNVLIAKTYDARAQFDANVTDERMLASSIAMTSHVEAKAYTSLEEIQRHLQEELLTEGDVLIIMGAGNVTKLASSLTQ